MTRACLAAAAVALALGTVGLGAPALAAPDDADVRAAQEAERSTGSAVAALELELAQQAAVRDSAWEAAARAAEDYTEAMVAAEAAAGAESAAQERLRDAEAQVEQARKDLGAIALEAHRSGGSMDMIGALLSADGFEDLVARTTAVERLGERAERVVQRFRAVDLVARTLAQRADEAAEVAAATAAAAENSLAAAQDAFAVAEAAVAEAEGERERLLVLLAEQRRTTVAVERARQDALDEERHARAEAAAAAERGVGGGAGTGSDPVAPPSTPGPGPNRPGDGSARPDPAPSQPPSDPGPSGPAPTPTPTTPAPSPEPERPAPAPEPTPEPEPEAPAPAPAPDPTPQPTPDPYGLGTGSARGSAAQGAAAVAWALEQVGDEYVWGGTGPDGFDCSGLTSQAWRAAGLTLPRTSRDQYRQVRKIAYGDMRPGDLVFYGRGNDPASITHVAMYLGGGTVVEASRPGVPVRVAPLRWSGTMPFAGRP